MRKKAQEKEDDGEERKREDVIKKGMGKDDNSEKTNKKIKGLA